MGRRKVFIPELNTFGEEVDYQLKCDDMDWFLSAWDIETLERMLETQLLHENYEMAELIKKHIDIKKNGGH